MPFGLNQLVLDDRLIGPDGPIAGRPGWSGDAHLDGNRLKVEETHAWVSTPGDEVALHCMITSLDTAEIRFAVQKTGDADAAHYALVLDVAGYVSIYREHESLPTLIDRVAFEIGTNYHLCVGMLKRAGGKPTFEVVVNRIPLFWPKGGNRVADNSENSLPLTGHLGFTADSGATFFDELMIYNRQAAVGLTEISNSNYARQAAMRGGFY